MANRLEGLWIITSNAGDVLELTWPTGITRMTGIGLPPAAYASQKTPTQHGSSVLGFGLEDREVIIGLNLGPVPFISGDCMEERRKRAYKVFNYHANPLTLTRYLPNQVARVLRRCWYSGGLDRDSANLFENLEEVAVRLVAHDPAWYDPASTTVSLVYGDFSHGLYYSTVSLDSTDGLTTDGDWYAYPTITIYGPCTSFDLQSTTTSQRLRYLGTVAAGETVTIVPNPLAYALSATSDVEGDVQNNIPPGDDFGGFCLWPYPLVASGNNEWELEVSGIDANSTFSFEWEDRYQGI